MIDPDRSGSYSMLDKAQIHEKVSDSPVNLLVSAVLAPAGVAAVISQWFSARNQKASLINAARLSAYAEIYGCLADVQQSCADMRRFLVILDPTDPYYPSPNELDIKISTLYDHGLKSRYQASVKTINSNSIFVSTASEAQLFHYVYSVRAYIEWLNYHIFERRDPMSGQPVCALEVVFKDGLSSEQKQTINDKCNQLGKLIDSLGILLKSEISVAPVELRCPEFWPDPRSDYQQYHGYPHTIPEGGN
ncbi:hypothetical protein [Synechococcus sp. 1G10]|uniref:hypothetical protein n=1 Tax=Synechococcus sp. 1G10 TaxID=2025605 RepID=UPI00117D106C|nr:hypothetical protein [Synechococcus sp. 1G10]